MKKLHLLTMVVLVVTLSIVIALNLRSVEPGNNNSDQNKSENAVEKTEGSSEYSRIMVGLNISSFIQQGMDEETAIRITRDELKKLLVEHNATIVADSDTWTIPYVAIRTDKAGIDFLKSSPLVTSVTEDVMEFVAN